VSFFQSPGAPWAGAIAVLLGFFLALSDAGETTRGLGVLATIAGFAVFAIASSARATEARRLAEEDAYERGRQEAMAEIEEHMLELGDEDHARPPSRKPTEGQSDEM
jgi:hypothetical protein